MNRNELEEVRRRTKRYVLILEVVGVLAIGLFSLIAYNAYMGYITLYPRRGIELRDLRFP